ncbi:hypothetical protein BCR37DRAFT_380886 [Protomyces lactucae-debilis]|uniref:Uncharacterized protein n=1 Tax=Protomyces lactucae-debilis TaxID=2754530 RepID=A0A1Y2FAR2_PROLT|nr:uncharacterized protein BCR37DRAFT_380886 [Protomyces lactucae-debilis]ORY80999.1 hypothetical protein BCR37DRAFT_380886 [Protomyces lactucae-debilis]
MREASCLQSYPEVKSLFGFEFLPLNSQRQIHHCSVICQCQIVITWKKIRMPSLKHFDQIYEFSPKTTKSFWTDQKIPLSSQRPKSCYPTEIIARVLSTKQLPDMEVEQWAIRPPVVVEERTRCDCLIWSMKCTCNPYGGTQREHRYVPDHCILGFQTPRTAATSISQDLQAPAGAIVANTQTCPTQPLIAGQVDTSTTQASGSGGHSHDQSQLTDRTPAVNEPQGPTTSAEVNQFLQNTQFGFNCRTDILPDENGLPQWSTSLYAMECFLMSDGATPGPLRENCQCPWPLADPLECELLQQSQNNTCTNLDAQSRSQEGQSKRQNTRGMNYGEQGGRFGNLPNFI